MDRQALPIIAATHVHDIVENMHATNYNECRFFQVYIYDTYSSDQHAQYLVPKEMLSLFCPLFFLPCMLRWLLPLYFCSCYQLLSRALPFRFFADMTGSPATNGMRSCVHEKVRC